MGSWEVRLTWFDCNQYVLKVWSISCPLEGGPSLTVT